jgi:hypothetical protein
MENLKSIVAQIIDRALPYVYGFAAGVVVGWLL